MICTNPSTSQGLGFSWVNTRKGSLGPGAADPLPTRRGSGHHLPYASTWTQIVGWGCGGLQLPRVLDPVFTPTLGPRQALSQVGLVRMGTRHPRQGPAQARAQSDLTCVSEGRAWPKPQTSWLPGHLCEYRRNPIPLGKEPTLPKKLERGISPGLSYHCG